MFLGFMMALSALGTFMGMYSQYQYASYAKKSGRIQQQLAEAEAKAMETRAGQERASAQRAAIEQKRRARLVGSRAEALVSAGGGDTSDIINQLGDIEREGEIRAQTAIYQGEETALGLEHGAAITRAGGAGAAYAARMESHAAKMGAMSTLLGGAGQMGSLYAKYADPSELYGNTLYDRSDYG